MLGLTIKQESHIYATGLMAIIALGTLGLIAVCLVAVWLVFEFAMLLLTSIIECCSIIATLYDGADSLVKVLILALIGLAIYAIVRQVRRC